MSYVGNSAFGAFDLYAPITSGQAVQHVFGLVDYYRGQSPWPQEAGSWRAAWGWTHAGHPNGNSTCELESGTNEKRSGPCSNLILYRLLKNPSSTLRQEIVQALARLRVSLQDYNPYSIDGPYGSGFTTAIANVLWYATDYWTLTPAHLDHWKRLVGEPPHQLRGIYADSLKLAQSGKYTGPLPGPRKFTGPLIYMRPGPTAAAAPPSGGAFYPGMRHLSGFGATVSFPGFKSGFRPPRPEDVYAYQEQQLPTDQLPDDGSPGFWAGLSTAEKIFVVVAGAAALGTLYAVTR